MKRFTEVQKKKITKVFEQELQLTPIKKEEQPEPESKVQTASSPVKFFSKLFEARQMAHIFHLQVKAERGSGWEHDAVKGF